MQVVYPVGSFGCLYIIREVTSVFAILILPSNVLIAEIFILHSETILAKHIFFRSQCKRVHNIRPNLKI